MAKAKILLAILSLLTSVWVSTHKPECAKDQPDCSPVHLSLVIKLKDKDDEDKGKKKSKKDEKSQKK